MTGEGARPGAGDAGRRKLVRGCCIAAAIVLAALVGLSVLVWLHMRERMTTDPADTRLLRVTAAPSLDAWISTLEIPVKELDEGLLDELRQEWPAEARVAIIEAEVPIRAMPASEEWRGYEDVRARDFTLLFTSGEHVAGHSVTDDWGGRQILSRRISTQDQFLYPGGFLTVSVIAPLPADALPGEIELRYRDTPFASIELPADAGASEVQVVWSDD